MHAKLLQPVCVRDAYRLFLNMICLCPYKDAHSNRLCLSAHDMGRKGSWRLVSLALHFVLMHIAGRPCHFVSSSSSAPPTVDEHRKVRCWILECLLVRALSFVFQFSSVISSCSLGMATAGGHPTGASTFPLGPAHEVFFASLFTSPASEGL